MQQISLFNWPYNCLVYVINWTSFATSIQRVKYTQIIAQLVIDYCRHNSLAFTTIRHSCSCTFFLVFLLCQNTFTEYVFEWVRLGLFFFYSDLPITMYCGVKTKSKRLLMPLGIRRPKPIQWLVQFVKCEDLALLVLKLRMDGMSLELEENPRQFKEQPNYFKLYSGSKLDYLGNSDLSSFIMMIIKKKSVYRHLNDFDCCSYYDETHDL